MPDRAFIAYPHEVRGFLDGRQTRITRPLKVQPPQPFSKEFPGSDFGLCPAVADGVKMYSQNDYERLPKHPTKWELIGSVGVARDAGYPKVYTAPFAAGDRLVVKETFATWMSSPTIPYIGGTIDRGDLVYRATDSEGDWADLLHDRARLKRMNADCHERSGNWVIRTAAQCPRWASRLTLTVGDDLVCRRVQDVSEEEARAEGIVDGGCRNCGESEPCGCLAPKPDARDSFAWLWTSLHGPDAWTRNDWVWTASVTVEPRNIDQHEDPSR